MRKYKPEQPDTAQTIYDLRQSIQSMEKMIEKSYKILNNTKVITHKQIKSDSVELRLNSLKKRNKMNSIFDSGSTTKVEPLTTLNCSFDENSSSKVTALKTPQKTKPYKHKLKINTKTINQDHENKQKILICDEFSPINMNQYTKKHYFDSSFASSLDQAYLKRLKTDGFNESRQESMLNDSLEKKIMEEIEVSDKKAKKIVLKRKKDRIKNMNDLDAENERAQRHPIFGNHKKGTYSYLKTEATRKQIVEKVKRKEDNRFRLNTLNTSGEKCVKNEKQNKKMDLDEFYIKVKKYGFVERYLSHSEICAIYNYLKTSSIPEYKWPLFVVDEVYEKMQTPKNG